jgi:hypothetical protein
MNKPLSLVIHTTLDLQRSQIIAMLASIIIEHYTSDKDKDDGKGIASTYHAWATVAEAGGIHELLSGLKNRSLQEAVDIIFPAPMTGQAFLDLVHALGYDDMKQMVLSNEQYALILKWAVFRIGDAVMHLYSEMAHQSEKERKGRQMMLTQRAQDTLSTIGWMLQPPDKWHGERRKTKEKESK